MSVVKSATPMVAVRPGSAPITMPTKVAQHTLNSVSKFAKTAKALARWERPSGMTGYGRRTRNRVSKT